MKIQKKLQLDAAKAMKDRNKDKLVLLRTVLGELDRIGKEVSDTDADKVIRSMWITASETENTFESEILEPYLLPRMSDEEIDISVRAIVTMGAYKTLKDLGNVMREFKSKNTAKPYDGVVVQSTARKWLLK